MALSSVLATVGLPFEPLPILTIIVVGLALKAVVGILVTRYVGTVVAKVTRDMRIRLIRSLLGARWGYFVRQPVGRLAFAIGPEADASGQCFQNLTSLLASVPPGRAVRDDPGPALVAAAGHRGRRHGADRDLVRRAGPARAPAWPRSAATRFGNARPSSPTP